MTQHRTAARRVFVSLSCFAYHKMLRLLPNWRLVGSQGLKRIKNTPDVDACAEIHFQMKIPDLGASTNSKQSSLFFKFNLQPAFFKLLSSISNLQTVLFKFYLQTALFEFYLQIQSPRTSFAKLFNFKLWKTCWNNPKLYKRILAHFEKMSSARWFWAFFEKKVFAS